MVATMIAAAGGACTEWLSASKGTSTAANPGCPEAMHTAAGVAATTYEASGHSSSVSRAQHTALTCRTFAAAAAAAEYRDSATISMERRRAVRGVSEREPPGDTKVSRNRVSTSPRTSMRI
eukprot:scaffold296187_cov44-Tisochrysis_lutea.AAC.1